MTMRSKEDIEIDIKNLQEEFKKERTRHEEKIKNIILMRNRLQTQMQLITDNFCYFIYLG